jgi:hypothetical protein
VPLVINDFSVRECFVPRPGLAFIDADIEALELCTLAQVEIWLLNDRRKADQLNQGLDPHCLTGCVAAGMNYKDFYRAAKGEDPDTGAKVPGGKNKAQANRRNMAKVPNFGKPGGMADHTLVGFARTSYGITLGATPENPRPSKAVQEAVAEQIGAFWRRANPNDQDYLDAMRSTRRGDGMYHVVIGHPSVGAVIRRGRATYCAACNSPFQGLGALAAGDITFELQRACYALPASPLYGCRMVVHAYDQWVLEAPLARVTEAAAELTRIIETVGARKIPDVRLRAPAAASATWSKSAERVVDDATGELLIWGTDRCTEYLESKKAKKAA